MWYIVTYVVIGIVNVLFYAFARCRFLDALQMLKSSDRNDLDLVIEEEYQSMISIDWLVLFLFWPAQCPFTISKIVEETFLIARMRT